MSALLLLAAMAAQAAAEDPLDIAARIETGALLCTNPDAASRTCSTLVSYRVAADGSVTERAEVLLSPTQRVTFEMTTKVEIEGARICGAIDADALDKVIIRKDGEIVDPAMRLPLAARIKAAMTPFVGHLTCDTLSLEGDQLVKQGVVTGDGKLMPAKPVVWVQAEDGYTVAPKG